MDKMRKEFSVHCQLWRYSEDIDENGFFTNQVTQRAWNAWQSAWHESRKALVVELPQPNNDGEDSLMRRVEIALDKAGVSY